jgi:hypothetical protein
VLQAPEPDDHYGVPVDAMLLAAADPLVADAVVRQPRAALEALEDALLTAQVPVIDGLKGLGGVCGLLAVLGGGRV